MSKSSYVGYVAKCRSGKLGLITHEKSIADGTLYEGVYLSEFFSEAYSPEGGRSYAKNWQSIDPKIIGCLTEILKEATENV